MKILHVSDVHLGSRLTSKFSRNISSDIKNNIKMTFSNVVSYAYKNDVKVIILAGDLFDNDKPAKSDINYFKSIVSSYPEIDFLYLRGNHDLISDDYNLDNLKMFSDDKLITYRYDDVVISGIEICDNNRDSYYSMINLNNDDINILTLHGDINNDIKLNKLLNRNIDYLALGHIHSYQYNKLDNRTGYAYSGVLEPRGFDETGDKGCIMLDINNHKIDHKFIRASKINIYSIDINITDDDNLNSIINKILETDINNEDIYRFNLVGEISYNNDLRDNMDYILNRVIDKFYYVELINKTTLKINYNDYINDTSIKGEFVRSVLDNPNYTDEEKNDILVLGLKVYESGEVL